MTIQKYECPVEAVTDLIGGRWKIVILSRLMHGTRRYGEIKHSISNITEKMLIQQLRQLEEDGLIERKQYPEVPPRVEYSLTKKGKTLVPIFQKIGDWGREHLRDRLV
ncbi:MAG: helix-turn-helix transcriptional regulator [Anaerolineales bacterium]|jgi:DNA-binding HxlR family transcriptional regulator|nr:helix-turn-helix transcriptional regulator [Anaerolineales bacterium]